MSPSSIHRAGETDADAIAALVNLAFAVESWFVDGDRIAAAEVRRLIAKPDGVFFVVRESGDLIGCIYAELRPAGRGYIGLLAVAPSRGGTGLGSELLQWAENHLARSGREAIDITVVNLRTELFPFYERRGYRIGANVPFPRVARQPCHLVTMTKTLVAAE